MIEEYKNKITVLFGSGADTDACAKLSSGQSFSEALILENDKEKVIKILGENFRTIKFLYPQSTKVFVQTVVCYQTKAAEVLPKKDIRACVDYRNGTGVSFTDVIKPLCRQWYDIVANNDDERKGIRDFFLENAVLCESLDEKFNSLRFTDYNLNAKRAISAYTQVFLLILQQIYEISDEFEWTFSNVFRLLRTEQIKAKDESYYKMLYNSGLSCNVVTTNYTDLAKSAAEKVVYLHGNLKWFEDLDRLTVYDCTDDKEFECLKQGKNILPFILIPSGVKPLICSKQIKEFGKFIDSLESSNVLLITGYKFNSEDNHINSIIADWLRKEDTCLIYLNYNSELRFDDIKWVNAKVKTVQYGIDPLELEKGKIIDVRIKKDNSKDAFKECIDKIKKYQQQ